MECKAYPSDVSDAEWTFVVPSLTRMTEDAPPREHRWREVLNGLHWLGRAGTAWRRMPQDLPPWYTVCQQSQRWLKAGVCAAIVHALRAVQRLA
jgi:transposase